MNHPSKPARKPILLDRHDLIRLGDIAEKRTGRFALAVRPVLAVRAQEIYGTKMFEKKVCHEIIKRIVDQTTLNPIQKSQLYRYLLRETPIKLSKEKIKASREKIAKIVGGKEKLAKLLKKINDALEKNSENINAQI
ncbi:MAG: hypothetical protein WC308_00430 [archaeon]|jgi:hypothetical protein